MKYHLVTFGCQMNLSDSERTRTVIEGMGFRPTAEAEDADLIGIIACSVRQKAIDKVYSHISRWNRLKNRKTILTFLSGCVLPADREKFLRLFDIVFPMSELQQLPDMIRHHGVVTPVSTLVQALTDHHGEDSFEKELKLNEHIGDFWNIHPIYASTFEAFVPIQNGCDKFCTFCAVPYTRGREISRPSHEILEEIQTLIAMDYKSITLLGQNVNSYGREKAGKEITFPQLLKEIGEMGRQSDKDFWVYFTSPHPRDMTDEVIEVVASYPHLAKQIHLPVQSGDDRVLSRMNRRHTVDDYHSIVHSIRRLLPSATLFTDIITGFTGETDDEFENTRRLMEEMKFNMAYIAQYSPRPGAASFRLKDDVPFITKKQRYHILSQELMKHSLALNQALVGKTMKVLVRGKERKEGFLSGYTEGRIPVRILSTNPGLEGKFILVRITSASALSIAGEEIPSIPPQ